MPGPRQRLCSRSARTPSTGSANAHRPNATTLGEAVLASFISTAELEMQTAPAVAAATGGIVVTRTERALPTGLQRYRGTEVMTRTQL